VSSILKPSGKNLEMSSCKNKDQNLIQLIWN
jgi:hypothetical protein